MPSCKLQGIGQHFYENSVERVLPKRSPGVKLALQTLNVGQEVDYIHICKILLESDGSCIPNALSDSEKALSDSEKKYYVPVLKACQLKLCNFTGRTSDFRGLCVQHTEIVRATWIGCQEVSCMRCRFSHNRSKYRHRGCTSKTESYADPMHRRCQTYRTAARLGQVRMAVTGLRRSPAPEA